MTKAIRIWHFIIGLFQILLGFVMATGADKVYSLVIVIFGLTMILSGIRLLVYYVSMARHMVGGMTMLYRGVIILDIGLFTLTLSEVPLVFVVVYLAGVHGFSGVIDILRAREARRLQSGSWRMAMSRGIVNILIAGICLAFIGTVKVAVLVYAIGLAYSGCVHIAQAFRKKKTIYGDIIYDERPAV